MLDRKDDAIKTEDKLGRPVVAEMHYEINPLEFDMVEGSMGDGRDHDVTMFIRNREDPSRIAVIRKPMFPPTVFRAPSLSLIHISEPTRLGMISYAVFCLKKKKKRKK